MTLLPIVHRELRVGARQIWPRWGRVAATGLATAICFQFFSFLNVASSVGSGQPAYQALAWTAFLLAACMFVVTADCLSRERREGTLVLLFLTDLKGYDVVLGKLAGSALNVLYALVGLAPVLMLPVIAGGVTWPETARMTLAILNMAFVALGIGVWRSVRTSQPYAAVRASLFWLAVLVMAPWLIAEVLPTGGKTIAQSLSPLFAFVTSDEARYGAMGNAFWRSLVIGQIEGWALIALACWTLMRNWREQFRLKGISNPVLARRAAWRRRMIGRTSVKLSPLYRSFAPVAVAVLRLRGLRAAAWCGGVLGLLGGFLSVFGGFTFWGMLTFGAYTGLHFVAMGLFAWMAGRFLCDAHRSGELELLVTTPAGATGIIRDQWFAVLRCLRGPILLVGIGALPQAAASVSMHGLAGGGELFGVLHGVCGMANAVLGVFAICWVGMWKGLSAKRPSTVAMWAVGLVEGIPLVAVAALAVMFGSVTGGFGPLGVGVGLWVVGMPFLMLGKNLFFIWWAQRQLCAALRAPRVSLGGRRVTPDLEPTGESRARSSMAG